MAKMFPAERKNKILEYLKEQHRATVRELSLIVDVSEATLRTDLSDMEEEGLLQRTHGGAVLQNEPLPLENTFSVREKTNLDEKKIIGCKAAELVGNNQCIMLDASSTALELARVIKNKQIRLTVVTNGIYAALELRENPGITVILIGGVLRVGSVGLEGTLGTNILNQINVDTMFASASGFTFEDGLTDFNVYEVELKKAVVNSSSRLVALLDHSKLERSSISSFAAPKQIHTIVTDSKTSIHIINRLQQMKINVIIA
jgi:DeoR/GlpR family transcriptional regulator of sugar metabolism